MKLILPLACLLIFCACGSVSTTGEDYGNLDASPGGLALQQSEHVYGWGKSDCTLCHNLNNIHISVSESGYDMAAVRAQVASQGLSACSVCHGTNGVQ